VTVVVRGLREDELDKMADIWVRADLPYRPTGRDSLENLRKQWMAQPRFFIGAFEDEALIGVAIATDDGRKSWINRLAVVPEERGKGVAKAIVAECERIFTEMGRVVFCIMIEGENDASEHLFEGLGYKHENDIRYYAKRLGQDL